MTIEIGSKVRELPEAAVKTTLDPMFKFFFELAGREGVVDRVNDDRPDYFVIRYTNAPEWAPEGSSYRASELEEITE